MGTYDEWLAKGRIAVYEAAKQCGLEMEYGCDFLADDTAFMDWSVWYRRMRTYDPLVATRSIPAAYPTRRAVGTRLAHEGITMMIDIDIVLEMLKQSLGMAERSLLAGAKRGSKSTSEAANLMAAEILSAWARAVETLRYSSPEP